MTSADREQAVQQLADAFVRETARLAGPWESHLLTWAAERKLTIAELKELRRAVLRRRVFGQGRAAGKRTRT